MKGARGETLIELVVSLALFSLLITMLVTVFNASSKSLANTVEIKNEINEQLLTLTRETTGFTAQDITIFYSYTTDSGSETDSGSFTAQRMDLTSGALYKFRAGQVIP